MVRCSHITKKGEQCKKNSVDGTNVCKTHTVVEYIYTGCQLGPWLVGEKIGSGSFGMVYNAKFCFEKAGRGLLGDRELIESHEWVVKIVESKKNKIDDALLSNEYTVYRILNESKLDFPMAHTPLTVSWKYQKVEVDGRNIVFLAIQKLWKNIGEIKNTLTPNQIIDYGKQIIMGFEKFHKIGYVYCDVKPENFMVDQNGKIYMIDFGCAQKYKIGNELKHEPAKEIGTPNYMSRSIHQNKPISPQNDLESLGYLLVELLGGVLPWASANNPQNLMDIKLNTNIDEIVNTVIYEKEKIKNYLEKIMDMELFSEIDYKNLLT